jgi:hypothetical protein
MLASHAPFDPTRTYTRSHFRYTISIEKTIHYEEDRKLHIARATQVHPIVVVVV